MRRHTFKCRAMHASGAGRQGSCAKVPRKQVQLDGFSKGFLRTVNEWRVRAADTRKWARRVAPCELLCVSDSSLCTSY